MGESARGESARDWDHLVYTQDPTWRRVEAEEIGATDLQSVLREEGDDAHAFKVTFYLRSHPEQGRVEGEAVFIPEERRCGITINGDSVWTDAGSIYEALNRYVTDTLSE